MSPKSRLPTKTSLLKSDIFNEMCDEFGLHLGPAMLRSEAPTPLMLALSRLKQETPSVGMSIQEEQFLHDTWAAHDVDEFGDPVVPQWNESLIVEGDPMLGIESMKTDTAVGWPLSGKKRDYLVDGKLDFSRISRAFGVTVTQAEDLLKLPVVFSGSLKDEKVSLAKIEARKTRLFWVAPLHLVYVGRGLFLERDSQLRTASSDHGKMIGINPLDEAEWTMLFDRVTGHGTRNLIAGDYRSWDLNVSISVMLCHRDYQLSLVEEGSIDEAFLDWYRTSLIVSRCELIGHTFTLSGGNRSGSPTTTTDNNDWNMAYFALAYYRLYVDHWGVTPSVAQMQKDLVWAFYGDDHIIGVHPDASWFNMITVHRFFETTMRIGYTDTDKNTPKEEYVRYRDLSFLSRSFEVLHDPMFSHLKFARLKEVNMLGCLYFISKENPESGLQENLDNVSRELRNWNEVDRVRMVNRIRLVLHRAGNIAFLPDHYNAGFSQKSMVRH